jgi:ethanolamine kinase
MKAIKKRPGYTQQDIDADAILLRAYGKGTDVLIDRESTSLLLTTSGISN